MESDDPESLMHRAIEHHNAGRLDQAARLYRQVLTQNSIHAAALGLLGLISHQQQDFPSAISLMERSLRVDPSAPLVWSNLSSALWRADRHEHAAQAAARAIALEPNLAIAHANLGNALSGLDRHEPAAAAYQRAVELDPQNPQAYCNLGASLFDLGRFEQAIASYETALTIDPNMPEAHWNLSLSLLAAGNARGWAEYEWRWRFPGFRSAPRNFRQPPWDGSPLEGKTLLLHTEQGLGDTLQFIRYLPRLVEREPKARIILECEDRLLPLMRQFPGLAGLVQKGTSLPAFDAHCPLLSLPLLLAPGVIIPQFDLPYLRADPRSRARWQSHLGKSSVPRVGLCWTGSPTHPENSRRSIPLEMLRPLAEVSSVQWFSLTIGPPADAAQRAGTFPGLIFTTGEQSDLAQTAALIDQFDLVISVDTAVAHLAGAMGKPMLLPLHFACDFRWGRGSETTTWYPTAKLVRQDRPGDWQAPIEKLRQQLTQFAAPGSNGPR